MLVSVAGTTAQYAPLGKVGGEEYNYVHNWGEPE